MYQNYIFDLYGTLVDIHTDEEDFALWEKLSAFYSFQGARYHASELRTAYKKLVTTALNEPSPYTYKEIRIEYIFHNLYTAKSIHPSNQLVLYTSQLFRLLSTEYLALFPGAKELLSALIDAKKHIYLLSNAQRVFTEYEMKLLDIYDIFSGILYSSDAFCQKPDPAFYECLFSHFDLSKEESIMIGNDPISDIKGAMDFGLDAMYLHSNQSPNITSMPYCTYLLNPINLYEAKRLLLKTGGINDTSTAEDTARCI